MEIKYLPTSVQNKIFYYGMVHPCCEMIRKPRLPMMKIGTCIFCKKNGRKLYPELFSTFVNHCICFESVAIISCICKSCFRLRYTFDDTQRSVLIHSLSPTLEGMSSDPLGT